MITKNSRRADSPWKMLSGLLRRRRVLNPQPDVLPESAFDLLIQKEISRCMRRPRAHQFGVIQTTIGADQLNRSDIRELVIELKRRNRITDEFGCWNAQLSLLLPETDSEGAKCVANQVLAAARNRNLNIETSILIFPSEDAIMYVSQAIQSIESNSSDDDDGFSSPKAANQANASAVDKKPLFSSPTETVKNLKFSSRLLSRPTPIWKRCIDVIGASIGVILFLPIYLIIAPAILLDSRGPVFFSQLREGKDGRKFTIYKFRTMFLDAEARQAELRAKSEQNGPAFKIANDPRITRVGWFLRKTCLDETPQIFNVLRGEMSLVGPRPLPVVESHKCEMWHRLRLTVLPGLTCIWQVSGGRNVTFEEWMRMDLDYIRNRSVSLDLTLLAKTFLKVVRSRGSV